MRQIYLQKQFYQLIKKPLVQPSETAKQRMRLLKAWETLQTQGMSAEEASQVVEFSRESLYRWQKRLREEG